MTITTSRTMTYDGQEFYARTHIDAVDGLIEATTSSKGLMSASDKTKLDGLSSIDISSLQPVSKSQNGLMTKEDKIKLDGLQNFDANLLTEATESKAGLMSAADKKRLDELKTNSVPNTSSSLSNVALNTESRLLNTANVWPSQSQSIQLSKKVSECKTGIVLVWRSDTTDDFYHYTHIPKLHAKSHAHAKISDVIPVNTSTMAIKTVQISDTHINGVNENSQGESRKIRLHEILEY